MKITNIASAGNAVKNDVLVKVLPCESEEIKVEIASIVKDQFEEQIMEAVVNMAKEMGITSAYIQLEDKGALDYVIRARTEAAIKRSMKEGDI